MIPVLGVGAGGHAKVVIETLRAAGRYDLVGLLDARRELQGLTVLGIPVLGDDDLLEELYAKGVTHAFVGVGSVGATGIRRRLYERLRALGFRLAEAIHPNAVIAPSARLGDGPTIMACAVVNAAAVIGQNAIVNTGAIIEHDCVIGDHAHVATGARLAGAAQVGEGAHVGAGASVREGIRIGRNAIVGAGAVVVRDVPDEVVVVGVPARFLRRIAP